MKNKSQISHEVSVDSAEISFEFRGLDDQVVQKLKAHSERESKMIDNFNRSVNNESILNERAEISPTANSSSDNHSAKDHDLSPTRFGDWEKKGRCYDF